MTKQDNATLKKLHGPNKPKTTKPATAMRRNKPIEKPGQGLKQTDILAFNQDAEKAFVRLITELLREDGKLSYREAVREAAYELNVSIETAKRYLEKHSARRAEFCIEDGLVTLRQVRR
jgi:predicted transcriptional regulator YheO